MTAEGGSEAPRWPGNATLEERATVSVHRDGPGGVPTPLYALP